MLLPVVLVPVNGLNRWHPAYKAGALPTELNRQFGGGVMESNHRVAMTVDLQSTPLPLRTNSPKLAMVGGFEPPTSWLTANCSTAELPSIQHCQYLLLNGCQSRRLVSAGETHRYLTFRWCQTFSTSLNSKAKSLSR